MDNEMETTTGVGAPAVIPKPLLMPASFPHIHIDMIYCITLQILD